jgi:hypothetical protein
MILVLPRNLLLHLSSVPPCFCTTLTCPVSIFSFIHHSPGERYVYDTTLATPTALLLFGGVQTYDYGSSTLAIDGWIKFKANPESSKLFQLLRSEMDYVLALRVADPSSMEVKAEEDTIVDTITKLLASDECE